MANLMKAAIAILPNGQIKLLEKDLVNKEDSQKRKY